MLNVGDPMPPTDETCGCVRLSLPGRVTFVFDASGVCWHRFSSQIRFGKHVDEALAIVKTLSAR